MSDAKSHYINFRFDTIKNKYTMQCKHCLKVLIDNKNSTGKVSHLRSCRPRLNLSNNIKGNKYLFDLK